jgi:D-alanyl-D-alanine carboxypeptidase
MNQHVRAQALPFIESWLEYQSRQIDIPGFVVAIQYDDETLLLRAYGMANREHTEPMTTNHRFGAASLSKMFTATAMVQLAERGALSLDDRAVKYLPWLSEHTDSRLQEITIRHLLRHGAGLLRDGQNTDFWQLERPFPDQRQLREEILHAKLVARPGGKLKYSNLGYALLGQIIEAVSGQPYNHFVTDSIIAPLGMTHTTPEYAPHIAPYLATGYTRPFDRHRFPVPKTIYSRAFSPLFGWHTTAQDLCRFMTAQFPGNNGFLSAEAKSLLHTSRRHHWLPPEERGTEYGLGFMSQQLDRRLVTGHGGVYVGHRSWAYADLQNKLAVIILTNARDAPVPQMVRGIFSVFDYFEQWGTEPASPLRARLNTRLMSFWATMQIVATHKRIAIVLPELWLPFADAEELEWVNPTTLKIVRTSDLASEGELVKLKFDGNKIVSAQYAGTTMSPEATYLADLRATKGKWANGTVS